MKYQHPQQTHQDFPASQGLAISFFTLGLSTISIYFCIAAILEYILIAILHPEAVFQSHFILGKLICSMLLRYFVCFVLVQKLVTCFKAELLPVFKLVAASLGTIKGEGERERHRTQLEGQKAKQQEAARQVQEQANFNQKYQEWLNQMNTYICEDVISSTCTGLPSFLPSSSRRYRTSHHLQRCHPGILWQSKHRSRRVRDGPQTLGLFGKGSYMQVRNS